MKIESDKTTWEDKEQLVNMLSDIIPTILMFNVMMIVLAMIFGIIILYYVLLILNLVMIISVKWSYYRWKKITKEERKR